MQMFFTLYVLGSLRLYKPKTEGQAMQNENLMEKLQNWNQNLKNLAQESSVVTIARCPSRLSVTKLESKLYHEIFPLVIRVIL